MGQVNGTNPNPGDGNGDGNGTTGAGAGGDDTDVRNSALAQDNVFTPDTVHSLYLWIHLKEGADAEQVAKIVSGMDQILSAVDAKQPEVPDKVIAGVGFGSQFYRERLDKTPPADFNLAGRSGGFGDLPSTGGDIFIHAKCDKRGKLFEVAAEIQRRLPSDSVETFQDIYGFMYRNNRDLSGFIDGTENRKDLEGRIEIATNKTTGGSFALTQKWVHDFEVIRTTEKNILEKWIGRTLEDSKELPDKVIAAHIARMTSGKDFQAKKPFEIVRQSLPFGSLGDEAGLFFIAFAELPDNFEHMLNRMVGQGTGPDGEHNDEVMLMSRCKQGQYWYFPSKEELQNF